MKKILILLSIFILCGCTNKESFDDTKIINELKVIDQNVALANSASRGFKYYKPRDFALLESSDFNHILVHKSNKFYLNVDVNAYYDKMPIKYVENDKEFYSKKIDLDSGIPLFIEIKEINNSYFLIKMMYNYSSIEVSTRETEIYDSIVSSMIILSSIKYNDSVIESIISEGNIDSRETAYEIKKPKVKKERTNILDVYDAREEAN